MLQNSVEHYYNYNEQGIRQYSNMFQKLEFFFYIIWKK